MPRTINIEKNYFIWIAERLGEFKIQIDMHGNLAVGGQEISRNHVVCLLRKDFKSAFPELKSKQISDYILATMTCLLERAKKELESLPPGHYEE